MISIVSVFIAQYMQQKTLKIHRQLLMVSGSSHNACIQFNQQVPGVLFVCLFVVVGWLPIFFSYAFRTSELSLAVNADS